MCVILICPQNVRPKSEVLYACHEANPHGAGVAWREGGRVRWQKNLNTGELVTLLKKLEGEVVIHFRWASVGGVDARLCHPFPVTPKASTSLSGMAETMLFHNGTWSGYEEALKRLRKGNISALAKTIKSTPAANLTGVMVAMMPPRSYIMITGR